MKIARTAASSAALALIFTLAAPAFAQDGGQTPQAPQYGATDSPGDVSQEGASTSGTEAGEADGGSAGQTGDSAQGAADQNGDAQGDTESDQNAASGEGSGTGDQTQPQDLTTEETKGGGSVERPASAEGGATESGEADEAAARPSQTPDAWMQDPNSWATFNGDLMAQKYSPADQITPDNVANLEKVWEYHTGDVSDGSGDIPTTVWSATPLFVNDTLYIGTPFYRIIALQPDTGEAKWSFNPDARLEARGVTNENDSYRSTDDQSSHGRGRSRTGPVRCRRLPRLSYLLER